MVAKNSRKTLSVKKDKREPVVGSRHSPALHKRAIALGMVPPINKNSKEVYTEALEDWIEKYSAVQTDPYRAAFAAVTRDERDFLVDVLTLYRHAESSPELQATFNAIKLMLSDRSASLKKIRSGK